MAKKITPLTRQYTQIKQKYPDTILLFRLGDFFETFNEDAKITAQVCGITLTKRNNGAAGEMPLAGFPHHQLDNYLPKLVRAGYRVAVCEQLEDPKRAKGIVKRDVVEVVTPGAALYDKLLDTKKNNYLAAINLGKKYNYYYAGIAFADISTGEFFVSEVEIDKLGDIIESFTPAEILINKSYKNELLKIIEELSYKPFVNKIESWIFDDEFSREALTNQFGTLNLKGFGIENYHIATAAAGAVLHYLKETQKSTLGQIKKLRLSILPAICSWISPQGEISKSLFRCRTTLKTVHLLRFWIKQPRLWAEDCSKNGFPVHLLTSIKLNKDWKR